MSVREADVGEIKRFFALLFCYADDGSFVSLRIFDQLDRSVHALHIEGVALNGAASAVIEAACRVATRAAGLSQPAVFAPPVATFNNPSRARAEDVANGLAISVELDEGDIPAARMRLEHLLGPATLVMQSGSEWCDPKTGELYAKLHLHWRLSEPTRIPEDHAKLRDARWFAAVLAGGDLTAAPPAHPLRWAGSWNLKGVPKLAHIVDSRTEVELHLDDAGERLQEAVEAAGLGGKSGRPIDRRSGRPQAPLALICSALGAVPNPDAEYPDWVRMAYAVFAATGGAGLECFRTWSAKSTKHGNAETEAIWTRIASAPPSKIGAGTIFHLARKQGWRPPQPEPSHLEHFAPRRLQRGKGSLPPPSQGSPSEPQAQLVDAPKADQAIDLGVWNPWEDPPPPNWPGGILPRQTEDTLAAISLRDGVDFGVLCMTVIAAATAAAPKDARFAPYVSGHWKVPPIIWCMLIGESGLRKTLLDSVSFAPIRSQQAEAWSNYRRELGAWRREKNKEREDKPEEPHSHIVNDYTPEALQIILGRTPRGTAVVKDELAGFFDFARYGGAINHGARSFFLSAYDDQPCPVHRIGRDSLYLEHTGVSVFGAIQPDKLAKLTGLESDGLLQRFLTIRVKETAISRRIPVQGLDRVHQAIGQLCRLAGQSYDSTADGEAMIRATETEAKSFATITDFGTGWKGFCHKVHGTHARLALILHLMENPRGGNIPAETVHRAARLTRYLLQHSRDFYSLIPDGRADLLRDIAGWLLTKKPGDDPHAGERIVASDLTHAVRGCRALGSKGIAEVLDPFATGGWLEPESDFPSNRAWSFNPAIRAVFQERELAERERRRLIREAIRALAEPVS